MITYSCDLKSDLRGEDYVRCHQHPYGFVYTNTQLSQIMETQNFVP